MENTVLVVDIMVRIADQLFFPAARVRVGVNQVKPLSRDWSRFAFGFAPWVSLWRWRAAELNNHEKSENECSDRLSEQCSHVFG